LRRDDSFKLTNYRIFPSWAEDRGSVTVEFVIGVPLILLALVFAFEFGNLFWMHNIVVNNVHTAARFLSRAPLTGSFLTKAENIARTGDPNTATGVYAWMAKTCAQGGICIDINQSYATFTNTDFRAAGKVIRIKARVPVATPLFGLMNILSGGNAPETLTFNVVEEARYFGE
jgi:Flp pilus assembly protein TadG